MDPTWVTEWFKSWFQQLEKQARHVCMHVKNPKGRMEEKGLEGIVA